MDCFEELLQEFLADVPYLNHIDIPEGSSGSKVSEVPSICEVGLAPLEGENSMSLPSDSQPTALDLSGPPEEPLAESLGAIRTPISSILPRERQRARKSEAKHPKNKRPTGRAAIKIRRQLHNDSAMRSRQNLASAMERQFHGLPHGLQRKSKGRRSHSTAYPMDYRRNRREDD